MADRFAVRPDDLRAVAPRFTAESDRLRHAVEQLRVRLEALGQPWGDDEQGMQFAAAYEASSTKIDRAVSLLAEGLMSIDQALSAMADNYVEADRAATVRLA